MKNLKYTNFILTVIAFLLAAIFAHSAGLMPEAYAKSEHDQLDVNIESIGGYSIYGGSLKVEVENTVDVSCDNC